MADLTMCMIVKDEESVLEESLKSISHHVDEIIITDTGSTDGTIEIAKKFTEKIHHFKWVDDFSAARNYCSQFATGSHIIRWDADFVLRSGGEKLDGLRQRRLETLDLVYFNWNIEFGDSNQPIRSLKNYFIYRADKFHWESPIHNKLTPNNPDEVMSVDWIREIEVDHLKDPVIKKDRYSQTKRILESQLVINPFNIRLLFNYAETLMFLGDWEGAINQLIKILELEQRKEFRIRAIEQLVRSYQESSEFEKAWNLAKSHNGYLQDKRFLLTYADALALVDMQLSIDFYEEYLRSPILKEEVVYSYDFERYEVHPRLMLANAYIEHRKDDLEIRKLLDEARSLTTRESTRVIVNTLLQQLD